MTTTGAGTEPDWLARARAGDEQAFARLTGPYRRELLVHCYRMLGSLSDAEDALQESLLSAWQGLAAFEGRSSVRTWLYRIATNRCLNVRRAAGRRPATTWAGPGDEPPEPSRLGEVAWLEPLPDHLLEGGPEEHVERAETVSLAFVTALQLLPGRQVAVLILRDVLEFGAAEVADLLDLTTDGVHSTLKRARAALRRHRPDPSGPPPPPGSATERGLVERFARAYGTGDIDGLVSLLTDDVTLTMPPMPFEYQGREAVHRFFTGLVRTGARPYEFVPVRANGQPAFGAYRPGAGGRIQAAGLVVLTPEGDRIGAITRFEASTLAAFGLPRRPPR